MIDCSDGKCDQLASGPLGLHWLCQIEVDPIEGLPTLNFTVLTKMKYRRPD